MHNNYYMAIMCKATQLRTFTLILISTAPNLTILKQDSLVSATVGEPYWIHCVISTSEKVNSSIVKIDWRGPNGPIVNSSRIIARPTISNDGIIYNSSLQFLYISQNDTGVFTCNVAILDNNASQVFQLDNLTST